MAVNAVTGLVSQDLLGAEGKSSVCNPAMFTDLMKRVKSFTSNITLLSQSAITGQSICLGEENAARGMSHIAMGEPSSNAGMIPISLLYGVSCFVSSVFTKQSYNRYIRAEHIGWKREKLHAALDVARGSLQTTFSAVNVSSRALSAVKVFLKKGNPDFCNRTLFAAAKAVHILANSILGVFQMSLITSNALSLRNASNLANKLAKQSGSISPEIIEQSRKTLDFISKRISATPLSTLKKIMVKHGDSAAKVKEHLSKVAAKAGKGCVLSAVKEYNLTLSKTGSEELLTFLVTQMDKSDLSPFIMQSLKLTNLDDKMADLVNQLTPSELFGLAVESQSRNIKKELKFSAATSSAALEMAKVCKEGKLSARLRSKDPFIVKAALKEAEELLKKVQSDLTLSKGIHGTRIFVSIVNLIGSILSAIFTGSIGALASSGVFLSSNIMSCGVDVAVITKNLRDTGSIGKYDEWIPIVEASLIVIATASSIVLLTLFSFGIVPLILASIGGGISFANSCLVYRSIRQKRARLEKEKPTLESLKKRCLTMKSESLLDSEMRTIIKKLPKSQRRSLKQQIALQSGYRADGVRNLSGEDAILDKDHNFAEKLFLQDPFNATVIKVAQKLWKSSKSEAIRGLYERLVSQEDVSTQQIHEYFQTKLSAEEKTSLLHSVYLSRAKKDFSWHFQQMDVSIGQLVSAISSVNIPSK